MKNKDQNQQEECEKKWRKKNSASLAFFNWKLITFMARWLFIIKSLLHLVCVLFLVIGTLTVGQNKKKIHLIPCWWNKIVNAVVFQFLSFNIFSPELFSLLHTNSIMFSFQLWTSSCGIIWFSFHCSSEEWRKNGYWKVGMILNAWLTFDYIGLRYHRSTDAKPLYSLVHVNQI